MPLWYNSSVLLVFSLKYTYCTPCEVTAGPCDACHSVFEGLMLSAALGVAIVRAIKAQSALSHEGPLLVILGYMPTQNTRKLKRFFVYVFVSLGVRIMNSTFQGLGFLYLESKVVVYTVCYQHQENGGTGLESQHMVSQSRKIASLSLAWATQRVPV